MERYYDAGHRRLIYVGTASSTEHWDDKWEKLHTEEVTRPRRIVGHNREILELTRSHLPAGSKILEGGCGMADKVFLLQSHGFETVGLDYAPKTIQRAARYAPELDLCVGDIGNLPFYDESFDGYWSIGLIEHFYRGYDPILAEMHRVLRQDGILFLVFPCLSLLRSLKAQLKLYPEFSESQGALDNFYQFALHADDVIQHAENNGFTFVQEQKSSGFLGLSAELGPLSPLLESTKRVSYRLLNPLATLFANHSTRLVLRKR